MERKLGKGFGELGGPEAWKISDEVPDQEVGVVEVKIGSHEQGEDIPEALESGFFERGEITEATPEELEAAKDEVPNLFMPSCAPRWARIGTLLVASVVSIAGGGKLGYDRFRDSSEKAQMERLEAERQEIINTQLESEPVERIDKVFEDAGERLLVDAEFEGMMTPEQAEVFSSTIKNFPTQEVFKVLSERSGDSITSIAGTSRLWGISVYSDASIDSLIEMHGDELSDERRQSLENQKHAGGTHKVGLIELNVTRLLEQSGGDLEKLAELIDDILFHEFMHTFPQGELKQGKNGEDDLRAGLYEGMTEWVANDVREAIRGENDDPFHGYQGGETAAAAFFVAAVDNQELLYDAYTSGHFNRLSNAYAEKTGIGLDSALTVDGPLAEDPRYRSIAMLQGLVETVGDQAPAIAAEANETLYTGHITVFEDEHFQGVFVTGDASDTGINNGVMWNADQTVTFASYMPEGRTENGIRDAGEYHIVFADVKSDGGSIDSVSSDVRSALITDLAQETSSYLLGG